ncbi:MAG TPA: Calx-beta domain-containing protein [Pyrinomonadaceae bacterium]|nr:Calx-beta domain-containing protein [Pyrinomonadaceae bacterium]
MPRKHTTRKRTTRLAAALAAACALALSLLVSGWHQPTSQAAAPRRAPARAAALPEWTRSGPHSGTVTALAAAPSSPSTVYAHVNSPGKYYNESATGLFKSTDAGAHWSRTNYPTLSNYARRVLSIAVDPSNPSVVYAGTTRHGVLRSDDGGNNWAGPFGPQDRDVIALAVNPSTTSTLLAYFAGQGLYKSTNSGETWTYSGTGIQSIISFVKFDPASPGVVWAVGGESGPGQFGGVYKSTDGGASWSRRNTGLPYASVSRLDFAPSDPSTLYIATSAGVFKSTDGAANWAASSTGLPKGARFHTLTVNPSSPSNLYVASFDVAGVWRSADAGATWALDGAGPARFNLVLADPAGANVYAGSFGAGMFKSAAGGPFAEANEGLPYAAVRNVVADANNPAVVYAGSGEDVYRSTDRGETWTVATIMPRWERPIMGLVQDPSEPATLYAAPDYVGVYKTTDGGLNWSLVFDAGNINVNTLAVSPSAPHNVYVSTPFRLYRSAVGAPWTRINSPTDVTGMTVDPTNPSVIYAAGFNLFKTTNGGATWTLLTAYDMTTAGRVNGLAVDRSNPATVYAYSNGPAAPVRKSTDGGATWNPASAGLPATGPTGLFNVSALAIDPVNSSVLYAACAGAAEAGAGVYRSADGGASWTLFRPALAGINALALDLSGRTLYAGADDGVYKTQTDAAAVAFSSDLFTAGESAGTAAVTVTRADGSGLLTVNYATSDGSARAGEDYTAASGSLAFAPGETTKTFNVAVLGDALDEFDEAARLTLADGSGAVLARASLVIADDDQPPAITVTDVSAPEGDFDTTDFVFHVRLSAPSAKTVTANVNNANGTADNGSGDIYLYGGPYLLQFAPGETEKSVKMLVRGDLDIEPDEDFFVNVTDIINAATTSAQGRGVILNDDAPPTVSLSINDVSVPEGNSGTTEAFFTVSLSAPTSKTVKVDYMASGVGEDYQVTGSSVTFAPGETAKTFKVLVFGDTLAEPDETYEVALRTPRNALIGDGVGTITIVNDEPTPTLFIDDVTVTEGDTGTKQISFIVSLPVETDHNVTYQYQAAPGTATMDQDYSHVFGADGIPAGVKRRAITVEVKGDTIPEANETFFVRLSNVQGATVTDGEGVCIIVDNDSSGAPPSFQFSASQYSVQESGGAATVTVTRAGDLSAPASVDYKTHRSNNTRSASDRSDYTTAAGTLRFAAGEGFKTFKVLVTDDAYAERDPKFGDEFIDLALLNPTGGVALGTPSAAFIEIVDNDVVNGAQNPVDGASFFVRQHYYDFFSREPDAGGLAHWTGVANNCGETDLLVCRVNVSGAFFLSIEFTETGYLVERMYKAAYGDATGTSTFGGTHQLPVPVVRLEEFLPDTQRIGRDVVVLAPGWEAQLEANKVAFAQEFVQRQRFLNDFPVSLPPAQFVDQLNTRAGNPLDAAERQALVNELTANNTTSGRASALRKVAEDATLVDAEKNRAFVLMQYFGYLRRNPNDLPDTDYTGYDFWLGNLERFNGNFVRAELVKAFITSTEYRQRFGQP